MTHYLRITFGDKNLKSRAFPFIIGHLLAVPKLHIKLFSPLGGSRFIFYTIGGRRQ
jgi:hypothetical protein